MLAQDWLEGCIVEASRPGGTDVCDGLVVKWWSLQIDGCGGISLYVGKETMWLGEAWKGDQEVGVRDGAWEHTT